MRVLEAGSSDSQEAEPAIVLDDLCLDTRTEVLLRALVPSGTLRPIQHQFVSQCLLRSSRRNVVVSAPTNGGKSAVGYLVLLDAVLAKRRAILLEPLRALAQEKAIELRQLLCQLAKESACLSARVRLCTGDYRLEGECFSDPAPGTGEIVVATPERLDAIIRNPTNQGWLASVGAIVVDEAHLVGAPRRGATLEWVLASLQAIDSPPRLALLSGTMGDPERLQDWLAPCDLLRTSSRMPPLRKLVIEVGPDEDPDAVLADRVREALSDDVAQALIFVYRRASTQSLATMLAANLNTKRYGGVAAYHAGMTLEQRERIRQDFATGKLRCCVTTTALALGINLPATHVFVRDVTFHGSGSLGINELLQMLGRAGRGGTAGTGAVLVRATDAWSAEGLARGLRDEHLEPLESAIRAFPRDRRTAGAGRAASSMPSLDLVAAALARSGENGETVDSLQRLLGRTLSGAGLAAKVEEALVSLEDPANALAYKDVDGRYRLTVLGRRGVRTLLPLPVIAGMGQLIRDLLTVDPEDQLLASWQPLDHLILVALLSDRTPTLRRYSAALADQIEGWIERQPSAGKSLLFRRWIFGRDTDAGPAELLGSLGLALSLDGDRARRLGYHATFSAILLAERSRGTSTADLQRRWKLSDLNGLEDSWRDTAIWMLVSIAGLYELRCFYHHLLEHCGADRHRVRRVKAALGRMRRQAYDLAEDLKYCSPLGALLRNARAPAERRDRLAVGTGTVRRLEAAGVRSIQQVVTLGLDGLIRAGVRRSFAKQLLTAARARSL